jgi:hypothetical protein
MIAWSGHEDVLTGLALILVAVTLGAGHPQPSPAAARGTDSLARMGRLKVG